MKTGKVIVDLSYCISLLFAVCAIAVASGSKQYTLQELCLESDFICLANVSDKRSYWDATRTRIFTDINLTIIEQFKGDLENYQVALTEYGGTIDGITTFLVGGPVFNVNEKSILFLKKVSKTNSLFKNICILGLQQGKFNLISDQNQIYVKPQENCLPIRLSNNSSDQVFDSSQKMLKDNFVNLILKFLKKN